MPETEYLHWARTHPVSYDVRLALLDVDSLSTYRSYYYFVSLVENVLYSIGHGAACSIVWKRFFLISELLKLPAGVYETTSHRVDQPCGNCE